MTAPMTAKNARLTMLSDHAIWSTAGIRYSPAAYGLTGPQPVTLAGLRAVEAAVRADMPREVRTIEEAFTVFVRSFNGDEAGDIDDMWVLDGATGWAMRTRTCTRNGRATSTVR